MSQNNSIQLKGEPLRGIGSGESSEYQLSIVLQFRYSPTKIGAVQHPPELTSAKNISIRAEWLRQSGRALSEPSKSPWWRIPPGPASIPRVASHIALQWQFCRFFSLCRSRILNKHSGVVANCDHNSEWVYWVHTNIGIAMQWVTLRISLLAFLQYQQNVNQSGSHTQTSQTLR